MTKLDSTDATSSGGDERNGSFTKQSFIRGPDEDDPSAEYWIKFVLHWFTWMELGLMALAFIFAAYPNPLNLHPVVWGVLLGYMAGKLPTIFRSS